jgi:hypothetical protein
LQEEQNQKELEEKQRYKRIKDMRLNAKTVIKDKDDIKA